MLGISTPTALSYTDERLHFIVRPFAGAVGVSDVMHGNARQHTDRLTEDYLACETFKPWICNYEHRISQRQPSLCDRPLHIDSAIA